MTDAAAEESSVADVKANQDVIDRAVVARMNAGSSSRLTTSSVSIFLNAISTVNIKTDFESTYEQKKNRCTSVVSFVSYLKKNEHFT